MTPNLFTAAAISDAVEHGRALLKFISPNDVGSTGSHQCGIYLPEPAAQMFMRLPRKGEHISKHPLNVSWPDGRVTDSVITWYASKREYRLTRFGRQFAWLEPDCVGNLLVLVARDAENASAHLFRSDEEMEEVRASLAASPFRRWTLYGCDPAVRDRRIREFAESCQSFPSGHEFSVAARALAAPSKDPDNALLECCDTEFELFRAVEERLCRHLIQHPFPSVETFLEAAATVLNRRKARAGRSLENHFEYLLQQANIPHEIRSSIEGRPDVVIPGSAAVNDPLYPEERIFVVGVKTTCKDRWRQVLNEARQVRRKFILTLQPGISMAQLREMHEANVTLIVPARLHRDYPRNSPARILTVAQFIQLVKESLAGLQAESCSIATEPHVIGPWRC